MNAEHAVVDYKKLSTYSLDPNHLSGGHKARVFQSALGYNPTNADVLGARVQEGVLTATAKILDANQHGQRMAVDMPILGANGETVIVRSGWIYEPDAVVPRMTTIFVK
ncbi:filamentous hemagglutinin [Citrobacter sp. A316]|nr:filamentous hemagglutinin [Citrobacter sp. A316]